MKGPLKKFSHSKTSHEQFSYFAQITMSHAAKVPDDSFISKQNEEIKTLIEELEAAFQRVLTNKHTQGINELDLRRDKLLIALRAALNSAVAQEILSPKRADAARAVLVHLDKMDTQVYKLGHLEESVQINAFLLAVKALDTETLTTSTALPIITALEETQTEFDALYTTKTTEDTASQEPRRISHIRNDMVFRVDGLLTYINVNGVDYPDQYDSVISSMNTLIDEVMAKAKASESRKESAESSLSE